MDYDLNAKPKNGRDRERKSIAMRAIELGYSCIAWNQIAYGKLSPQIKPPAHVEINAADLKNSSKYRNLVSSSCNFRQFTRITVSVDILTEAQALTFSNEGLRKFDIVAASTTNAKVFAFLCKQAEIDIISLDFTRRLQFSINKKLLDIAIGRGIYFEIQYAPIVVGPGSRRQVTSSITILLQYLRGTNIIFSSGCESVGQLRSPLDISILAQLLGVPIHKSKKTVSDYCGQVIRHAQARRMRYLPLEITSATEFRAKWLEGALFDVQSESTEEIKGNEGSEDDEEEESDLDLIEADADIERDTEEKVTTIEESNDDMSSPVQDEEDKTFGSLDFISFGDIPKDEENDQEEITGRENNDVELSRKKNSDKVVKGSDKPKKKRPRDQDTPPSSAVTTLSKKNSQKKLRVGKR